MLLEHLRKRINIIIADRLRSGCDAVPVAEHRQSLFHAVLLQILLRRNTHSFTEQGGEVGSVQIQPIGNLGHVDLEHIVGMYNTQRQLDVIVLGVDIFHQDGKQLPQLGAEEFGSAVGVVFGIFHILEYAAHTGAVDHIRQRHRQLFRPKTDPCVFPWVFCIRFVVGLHKRRNDKQPSL